MRIDFFGRFYNIGTKIADLVILNLLFILCSLPIVTIGASITAMYYVTMKMSDNKESYMFKSFFKSFKENFKQATIIWIFLAVIGVFLFVDFRIVLVQNAAFFRIFLYVLSFTSLLYSFLFLYAFPVLAKFYNTTSITVRNAFLMALRHLPYTLLMLLITLAPFALFFFNYSIVMRLLPVIIFFGFSLPAYLNSYFFTKIFANYIPAEELSDEISDEDLPTPEE